MHHEENTWIWISGSNEPASNCHATTDEVGEGEARPQQCLFLVLNDPRFEHDLFLICPHLDLYIIVYVFLDTQNAMNRGWGFPLCSRFPRISQIMCNLDNVSFAKTESRLFESKLYRSSIWTHRNDHRLPHFLQYQHKKPVWTSRFQFKTLKQATASSYHSSLLTSFFSSSNNLVSLYSSKNGFPSTFQNP